MSVHPKHYRRSNTPAPIAPAMVAADLIKSGATHHMGEVNSDHPLAGAFTAFLGGKTPTKRQASAFLAANPAYRVVAKAA